MRLIDADKIRYRDMSDGQVNGGVWYTFIEDIQKQPTVDAVPVIRCKDCKWYEMGEEETYCRELGIFNTDPTSYCSYARRKEE